MIDRTLLTPMTSQAFSAALAEGTTTFTNVDLSNQPLELPNGTATGLVFQNCSLDGASVAGTVSFNGCSWTDCSLRSFSGPSCHLSDCALTRCTLGSSGGDDASLFQVSGVWTDNDGPVQVWSATGLSATGCNLAGSSFAGVHSSRFETCQLNDAQVGSLSDTTFVACGMKTASLSCSVASAAATLTAQDCMLDEVTLNLVVDGVVAELVRCSLRESSLSANTGAAWNLTQCSLVGAHLSGRTLRGRLEGCDLRLALLGGASLLGASPSTGVDGGFFACNFGGADLRGASLSGSFERCAFDAADLSGTLAATDQPAPALSGCSFQRTNLTDSDLLADGVIVNPTVPTVTLSSPSTTTGGVITGRVASAGLASEMMISVLSRLDGAAGWSVVSSQRPRADGTFIAVASAPSGSQTIAEVAVVVVTGDEPFVGGALPPVSTSGRGVIAVASATTVPSDRAALELGSSRPQGACPSLSGDFTISAWLTFPDPSSELAPPGTVALFDLGAATGQGLVVVAGEDGALSLLARAGSSSTCALATAATLLRDGSWHHVAVARRDGALSVVVDGLLIDSTTEGGVVADTLGGSGAEMRLGWTALSALPGGEAVADLVGALDELTLRNIGQRPVEVRQCMYLPPAEGESLLGWWSFNGRSGAATAPQEAATLAPTVVGATLSFTAETLPFTPVDQPYLVVQQQLLRDVGYAPEDPEQTPVEVPGFHLVISVKSAIDLPQWMDLELAVADVPGGLTQVAVMRDEEVITLSETPTSVTLNAQGNLSLVVPPVQGALIAPMLRVRAPFMAPDEWVVIALDRHLHWKLSSLSADQVQSTWGVSDDVAAAFAPAISALASGCYEHGLASNHPVLRPAGQPGDTRTGTPRSRRYESPQVTRAAFSPVNQVSTSDVVAEDEAVERIAQLESLDVPHFSLTLADGVWSYAPLTDEESVEQLRAVPAGEAGSLEDLWPVGGRAVASGGARDALDVDATEVDLADLYEAAAVTDALTVARRAVVDGGTGARVSTLVAVAALPGGEAFVYATLTTVPQLVGLAQTLLVRVQGLGEVQPESKSARPRAALAQDGRGGVVSLSVWDDMELVWDLADAFDWDAITATFQVVWEFLKQGVDWMKDQVDYALEWMRSQLQGIQSWLDTNLDSLKAKLGTDTMRAMRAAGTSADPLPVSASKLQRAFSDNASDLEMDTPSTSGERGTLGTVDLGSVASAITSAAGGFGSVNQLFQSAMTLVLDICQGVLDGTITALSALLEVVKELADAAFDMLDDALTTHIDIPVITWLYENWLMSGEDHHKLKGRSLLALVVSLPYTILATMVTGHTPFGTDSSGHKVTDAINAIPGYLSAHSLGTLLANVPVFSGVSMEATRAAAKPPTVTLDAAQSWGVFGAIATGIVGICVEIASICAIVPLAPVQLIGTVAGTVGALFGAPMWGIATTSTTLQWVSFGLDIGAWAVSSVLTVLMDWVMLIPGVATTMVTRFLSLAPVGSVLRGVWQDLLDTIDKGVDKVLSYLSMVMTVPKALLGLVGLGLAIGADVVLLVDNQVPSTALKIVADVLYNVGVMTPGVTLVLLSVFSEGAADASPSALMATVNAVAFVPLVGSAASYITRAGLLAGGI